MRNKLKILTVALIMSILGMLMLELILRLTDTLGVEYFSELERYFATHVKNENYSYIHPPEMDEIFQGVRIKTNSYGLRGQEFERTKPEGRKRILILGDSVVLGWGVEYEDTFPCLLHNMYGPEENIEVIPAGVSVDVINAGGDGTEYSLSCSFEQIMAEMTAHASRRAQDTSFYGLVTLEHLVELGLVDVRYDRRLGSPLMAVEKNPTTTAVSTDSTA